MITKRMTFDPCSDLLPGQRAIAMISEMIHTASLVHDDVIDGSDRRRGKTTINEIWGEKKVREHFLFPLRRTRGIIFPLSGHPGWRLHPVRRLHGLGPDRQHHGGEGAVAGDRGPGARYRDLTTTLGGRGGTGTCASSRLCCASRGIHAAGIQGERERAIQTLPGENLQEDGEPHRQQLQSSMYVPSPDK